MSSTQDLYNEAEKLKDSGDFPAAIEKLEQLLAMDDSFTIAHSALAVLYGKVQRHDDAIKHAVRVSELDPDDSFSWTALSVTYQRAFAGTGTREYIQMAEDAMARSRMVAGH